MVADHGRLVAHVEGVGVLHDEFLGAHEAEARADFIAKLHLDLVEVFRELPVAGNLGRGQRGDDFLVRRAEQPFLFGAVAHVEEHVGEGLVAAGLLPDVGRLEGGHQHFERAGAVHLLADDSLDFVQRAQAQRQESVNAAGQLADEAGAQEQFVGRNLRVGGSFLEGGNEGLGPAHGFRSKAYSESDGRTSHSVKKVASGVSRI